MRTTPLFVTGALAIGLLAPGAHAATRAFPQGMYAAGSHHALLIKPNGTLWSWGLNNYGQLGDGTGGSHMARTQVGTDNHWLAVAAGEFHTIGLMANGAILAWGRNTSGQLGLAQGDHTNRLSPTQVLRGSWWENRFVQICAGKSHTLALTADGVLFAWGANTAGQMGRGTNDPSDVPVREATGSSDWRSISCSGDSSSAIRSDGTLWAWGVINPGAESLIYSNRPIPIATDKRWVELAAGQQSTLAIRDNGTLWNVARPVGQEVQIGTADNWIRCAAGRDHNLAITAAGALYAWGANNAGQLGDGTTTTHGSPAPVPVVPSKWVSVQAGGDMSMGLTADGLVYTWGSNTNGELGRSTDPLRPGQIESNVGPGLLSPGALHTLQVRSNGWLYAWGSDDEGQVGDNGTGDVLSRRLITSTTFFRGLGPGGWHSLAIKSNGTLWAWGRNAEYELGDGTTTVSRIPKQIGTANNWKMVAGGSFGSIGVRADGTLWGWGRDVSATSLHTPTPIGVNQAQGRGWIAVSATFNDRGVNDTYFAIRSDGTLWAWGDNSVGQIGNGTVGAFVPDPTLISSGPWTALGQGGSGPGHILGLLPAGALMGWGEGEFPTAIDGSNDWIQGAGGTGAGKWSLALRSIGVAVSWGAAGPWLGTGAVTEPPAIRPLTPIATAATPFRTVVAGMSFGMGISYDGYLYVWGAGGALGLGDQVNRTTPVRSYPIF